MVSPFLPTSPLDHNRFTLEGWHQSRKTDLEPINQDQELYDALADSSFEDDVGQNYFKNALQNLSEGLAQKNTQPKLEARQIHENKKRIDTIISRVTRPSRRITSAVLDENVLQQIHQTDENEAKNQKNNVQLPFVQKSLKTPKAIAQYNDTEFLRKDTTPSPRAIKPAQKTTYRGFGQKASHYRAPLSDFINGNVQKNYEELRVNGAASVALMQENHEINYIPRFRSINLITDHATQSGVFTTNLPEDEVMQISPVFVGTPYNLNSKNDYKEPSYVPKRDLQKKIEQKPPRKSDRITKKKDISTNNNKTPRTLSQILSLGNNDLIKERFSERPQIEKNIFKSYEKSPQKSSKPPLQKSPSSKRYLLPSNVDIDANFLKIPRASLHSLQRIEGYEEPPILNLHRIRESSLEPYSRSITPAAGINKESLQDLPSGALSKEPVWKVNVRKKGEFSAGINKLKLKETLNGGQWDKNSKKLNNLQLARQIKSHLFN